MIVILQPGVLQVTKQILADSGLVSEASRVLYSSSWESQLSLTNVANEIHSGEDETGSWQRYLFFSDLLSDQRSRDEGVVRAV